MTSLGPATPGFAGGGQRLLHRSYTGVGLFDWALCSPSSKTSAVRGPVLFVLLLLGAFGALLSLLLLYDRYRGRELEQLATLGNTFLGEVREELVERFDLEASGLHLTGRIDGRDVEIVFPEFEPPKGMLPSPSELKPNGEFIKISVAHHSHSIPEDWSLEYGHLGDWKICRDAKASAHLELEYVPEPLRSFYEQHEPASPVTDNRVPTMLRVDTNLVERFADSGPDAQRSPVDSLADDIERTVGELGDYADVVEQTDLSSILGRLE